jgi:hypothetical protein
MSHKKFFQFHHILIDERQYSSVVEVQSFGEADCDTNRYLVHAKVRDRLSVSKQSVQKFDTKRFNLKKKKAK